MMIELCRVKDLDLLMRWRSEVLRCVFEAEPSGRLLSANAEYYRKHLLKGQHIAYVARLDGIEAGCGAVCLYEEMPSPDNESGLCAYLMNIYVRPNFRNKGVATALIKKLVGDALSLGCGKIYLETTEMGRSVYKKIGFNEMKGFLKYESCKSQN